MDDERRADPDVLVDETDGPQEQASKREAARFIDRFLDSLDDERRAAFVLAELEQLSAPEIAAVVGVPLNTVYSRLRLARIAFTRADRPPSGRRRQEDPMSDLDEAGRAMIALAGDAHDPTDADRARVRAALAGRLGAAAGLGLGTVAVLGATAGEGGRRRRRRRRGGRCGRRRRRGRGGGGSRHRKHAGHEAGWRRGGDHHRGRRRRDRQARPALRTGPCRGEERRSPRRVERWWRRAPNPAGARA